MAMSCIASNYEDISLHTFVSMVGYYMKNIDHFQFVHHNVSGEMMEVAML